MGRVSLGHPRSLEDDWNNDALYDARGMTVREVQGFLAEQYGVEASSEFISSVTDAVMAEVTAWQARPLEPMYPESCREICDTDLPTASVVRRKRRPPPWTSLRAPRTHTPIAIGEST